MADRFGGLKNFIYGDENERTKPSGALEHLDAYTGAPTRSAITKLQEDFTDIPGAAKAAYEQFGASPKTAPTGQDLAKNMQLEGVPGAIAGAGLEFIADPSALVSSGAKLAAMPLIGLKGLKALDTAGDAARAVNTVEKAAKLAQEAKAAENLAAFAGKTRNAASAAEQIKAINKAKVAAEAAELAKVAELAKQEKGMANLAKELRIPEAAKNLATESKVTRPTSLAETVARPDIVFDKISADTLGKALEKAKTTDTGGKFGKIIMQPSRFEKLQAAMKAKK